MFDKTTTHQKTSNNQTFSETIIIFFAKNHLFSRSCLSCAQLDVTSDQFITTYKNYNNKRFLFLVWTRHPQLTCSLNEKYSQSRAVKYSFSINKRNDFYNVTRPPIMQSSLSLKKCWSLFSVFCWKRIHFAFIIIIVFFIVFYSKFLIWYFLKPWRKFRGFAKP